MAKYDTVSEKQRKNYKAVSVPTFWRFFAKYLIASLDGTGEIKVHETHFAKIKQDLIGENRYLVIFAACHPTEPELEDLTKAFTVQVLFKWR